MQRKRNTLALTALAAAVLALVVGAEQAQANLLVNGNFETAPPAFTPWTFTPDANSDPNMTATVTTFSGSNAFRVAPGSDSGHTGTEQGGILSQSVSLVAGQAYDITGDLLAIEDLGGGANSDGGLIRAYLDGTLLHTFDVGVIGSGATITDSIATQFTSSVTGAALFELHFTREYTNTPPAVYHYADDLSITAVPEPASLALLAVGGLAMLPRRRRKQVEA